MKNGTVPHQDLTDWFIKKGDDVLSYELIAAEVKKIRLHHELDLANEPVRHRHLATWIAQCRGDMELRYRKTLYNVRTMGYKVASPRELALYTARFLRRTLTHADRTMRLADIVDRKEMPSAIREVFFDQAGKVKRFRVQGAKFMSEFSNFLTEEIKKQRRLTHEKEKTRK